MAILHFPAIFINSHLSFFICINEKPSESGPILTSQPAQAPDGAPTQGKRHKYDVKMYLYVYMFAGMYVYICIGCMFVLYIYVSMYVCTYICNLLTFLSDIKLKP